MLGEEWREGGGGGGRDIFIFATKALSIYKVTDKHKSKCITWTGLSKQSGETDGNLFLYFHLSDCFRLFSLSQWGGRGGGGGGGGEERERECVCVCVCVCVRACMHACECVSGMGQGGRGGLCEQVCLSVFLCLFEHLCMRVCWTVAVVVFI